MTPFEPWPQVPPPSYPRPRPPPPARLPGQRPGAARACGAAPARFRARGGAAGGGGACVQIRVPLGRFAAPRGALGRLSPPARRSRLQQPAPCLLPICSPRPRALLSPALPSYAFTVRFVDARRVPFLPSLSRSSLYAGSWRRGAARRGAPPCT
ncbi:MAG: hypothetical protein J3K34DRAFT_11563 [Monoraphidium minutum]|nr:MAG: hypothetical protein J3K34DRAFT_11563 [Monoraphidium minutum]